MGGFEFWIHNFANAAYSVATIDCSGTMSLSGIVATNNITSPLLTATTRVKAPYVTLNNLYNVGSSVILTSLNNNRGWYSICTSIFAYVFV